MTAQNEVLPYSSSPRSIGRLGSIDCIPGWLPHVKGVGGSREQGRPKDILGYVYFNVQMTIQEERYWMYNRLFPGRKGLTVEFIEGVETFIQVASQLPSFQFDKMFRCPCSKHKNLAFLKPDDVKLDLYRRGFPPNYWIWTSHGKYEPHRDAHAGSSTAYETFDEDQMSRPYEDLIFDVAGHNLRSNVKEPPNAETQKFFELLHSAQKPIWEGCSTHSELSIAVRMLSIKTEYNIPRECFNDVIGLMKETNPADNIIPSDLYRTKKLVSKLGLTATKIDCCINGCMFYYKDDAAEVICRSCNAPRFKQNSGKQRRPKKDVSYSRLFYLPIIPRLQRLYASMSSAGHMRWHKEKIAKSDVLSHPSDAEAWKHFDRVHPSFAAEPCNIRLRLCTDGFTPYSQTATPYSCWPVILTPYNLPPEMCMTTPFMFLTLIIPGPHNPKAKIDIYLQPLIDDLKLLWEEGVLTYDISIKQNFLLRAAWLWTIGDEKSKKAHDDFLRARESRQSTGEGSSSGSVHTSEYQTWSEVVGGRQRGRVYGIGSQAFAIEGSSYTSAFHDPSGAEESVSERVAALTREIEEMKRVQAREIEEMRKAQNEMQAELQSYRAEKQRKKDQQEQPSADSEDTDDD
ncbi:hypothetical protein KFK09_024179 [Dendrobium nobile]|uniref:Transposase-associated domain-containing protein n=1 Tax=Dendrobium nobile TaxID=94219 RepID=A0A8T3AD56_DENNO|nr:hypothetical protein KFK09_024179 [Dendrobium nobile]